MSKVACYMLSHCDKNNELTIMPHFVAAIHEKLLAYRSFVTCNLLTVFAITDSI